MPPPVNSHGCCPQFSMAYCESPVNDVESVCSVCSTWTNVAFRIHETVWTCSHMSLECLLLRLRAVRKQYLIIKQINIAPTLQLFTVIPQITTSRHAPLQWPSSTKICGRPYMLCATCQMLDEVSSNLRMHGENHCGFSSTTAMFPRREKISERSSLCFEAQTRSMHPSEGFAQHCS